MERRKSDGSEPFRDRWVEPRDDDDVVLPRSVQDHTPIIDEPDTIPWSSRVVEVQRSDTEIVRAVWWWKGEELVINLQWLVCGPDGRWHARTSPPPPPAAPPKR